MPTSAKQDVEGGVSVWIEQVYMAMEKYEDRKRSSTISKVPNFLRVPPQHFTPMEWMFGLHNRDRPLHTGGTERFKIALAAALQLSRADWEEFCEEVVEDPAGVERDVYGLHDLSANHTENEIRCMLSLDALFMVVHLQENPKFNTSLDNFKAESSYRARMVAFWVHDILLLENQIPIRYLENVLKSRLYVGRKHSPTYEGWEKELDLMLKKGIRTTYPFPASQEARGGQQAWSLDKFLEQEFQVGELGGCFHFLECLYNVICKGTVPTEAHNLTACGIQICGGTVPTEHINSSTANERSIKLPSASTLTACGIQIKATASRLSDIAFCGGTLRLPFIQLYDETAPTFRNLALYEQIGNRDGSLRSFLLLMDSLIKSSCDVKLLMDRGVIANYFSNEANVCEMWSQMCYGINDPMPEHYEKMRTSIAKHCKSSRKVMTAEFIKLFCSRPWLIITVVAATIVTIATCIQTYIAVIGSNNMRPHFPAPP